MTDEPRDPDLEARLDQAFGSMRPRAGFESELWERLGNRPVVVRRATAWWTWAGAAAAVVVIGAVGVLFFSSPPHSGAGTSAGGRAAFSNGAADVASFGALPRPAASAAAIDPAFAPVVAAPSAGARAGEAAPVPGTFVVARYREPSADDEAGLAASLGAQGSGARYSTPEFTLVFFPTDPALGLPAHYLLTVLAAAGKPPDRPPAASTATAAAQAFVARHGLASGGAIAGVRSEGPYAIVSYASGMEVYVRGDGAVAQLTAPTPAVSERATYPLASADQLRALAHAPPGTQPRLETVLVVDGGYVYYEPVAVFGTFRVPAIDPSSLR